MSPLTRSTVTTASRIMLPTYVVLFTGLGTVYAFAPTDRLDASPALAYAATVLPIRVWGAMFVTIAAFMAAALIVRHRTLYRYALSLGVVTLGVWAVVFAVAAVDGTASPSTWLWPAFATVACWASGRSLRNGEA